MCPEDRLRRQDRRVLGFLVRSLGKDKANKRFVVRAELWYYLPGRGAGPSTFLT